MRDYSLHFQSLGLIVRIVRVCQFVGHSQPFFKCFSGFCSDLTLKSFISQVYNFTWMIIQIVRIFHCFHRASGLSMWFQVGDSPLCHWVRMPVRAIGLFVCSQWASFQDCVVLLQLGASSFDANHVAGIIICLSLFYFKCSLLSLPIFPKPHTVVEWFLINEKPNTV